jgi:hypothetical protein
MLKKSWTRVGFSLNNQTRSSVKFHRLFWILSREKDIPALNIFFAGQCLSVIISSLEAAGSNQTK